MKLFSGADTGAGDAVGSGLAGINGGGDILLDGLGAVGLIILLLAALGLRAKLEFLLLEPVMAGDDRSGDGGAEREQHGANGNGGGNVKGHREHDLSEGGEGIRKLRGG